MALAVEQPRRPPDSVDAAGLVDPMESARAAGLRYVSDLSSGIRRKRAGKSFTYSNGEGRGIRDSDTIRRIKGLAIPPAWTDVWICPDPRGHLQATGRDARRRKQYRYHSRWREVRDAVKYDRMLAFAAALPKIREQTDRDLERPGMPRQKVLAAIVRLLEETRIRVGNEEYRKENGSFGLTTLRNRHAEVIGADVHFSFRGKSGKLHRVDLQDRRLADRKSTRLNSSHTVISYAVFCLKKKKEEKQQRPGHVEPGDVTEAAPTAGLSQTSSISAAEEG